MDFFLASSPASMVTLPGSITGKCLVAY